MNWIIGLFDRLCAALGALLFSQFPQFYAAYTQRLSGHLQELAYQAKKIETGAHLSNKTLPEYLNKFTANQDPDFSRHGEWMGELIERYQTFSSSYQVLTEATILTKPFHFLANYQTDLFIQTLKSYQPGIPLTLEGGVWAMIGLCIGYLFFSAVKKLLLRSKRRESSERKV